MIIPSGMTQEETLQTIDKVCRRLAPKYRFGMFDADDIYQEACIIAMSGLHNYDASRPLENFLSVHVGNRLKNFKRDNFIRPEPKDLSEDEKYAWNLRHSSKHNLAQPLSIESVYNESEKNMWCKFDFVDDITISEIFETIDQELCVDMRADFLRMRQGVFVPKARREKIEGEIISILREAGYDNA